MSQCGMVWQYESMKVESHISLSAAMQIFDLDPVRNSVFKGGKIGCEFNIPGFYVFGIRSPHTESIGKPHTHLYKPVMYSPNLSEQKYGSFASLNELVDFTLWKHFGEYGLSSHP